MIEHCWLRRIAPCSDPASGPGEDMTKQPSSACLSSTPRGELETTSARVHPHTGTAPPPSPDGLGQPLSPGVTDRAVKASPTGGLRPALTALPTLATAKGPPGRARTPLALTPRRSRHGQSSSSPRSAPLTKPAASDMPIWRSEPPRSAVVRARRSVLAHRAPIAESGHARGVGRYLNALAFWTRPYVRRPFTLDRPSAAD